MTVTTTELVLAGCGVIVSAAMAWVYRHLAKLAAMFADVCAAIEKQHGRLDVDTTQDHWK